MPVPPPEELRTASDPFASVHLPPEPSLEQRLVHYREMTIMRELPGSELGRCILRDRMIDVMVAERLDDPADFTDKVPKGMRESTDGRQMRHLPDICEMIAEAAREPRAAAS
jgi:hypothetical protein